MHRISGAGNIAGPSTSTGIADPMMNTTANLDDVDMPTESLKDSDSESRLISGSYFDAESPSNDDGFSALAVQEEEGGEENPNRSMVVRDLVPTSFQKS